MKNWVDWREKIVTASKMHILRIAQKLKNIFLLVNTNSLTLLFK